MSVVASERRIVSQSETFAIVANGAPPHQRDVLPDPVEDDDRVVDRVAEHGQHRGDRRVRHLPPEQRVDADRDHDVVQQRDDHRPRELEVEPDREVEDDQEQREEDRDDRRAARSVSRSSTETFWIWIFACGTASQIASFSALCLRPLSVLQAQLEALVLVAADGLAAALDDRSPCRTSSSASRTEDSEVGCGVVNETCVPPLKSIPRLRPLTASAPIEITTIAPEIANQR